MWTLPPDAPALPGSDEGPAELWARSLPLGGSAAEAYLDKRRVPLAVAAGEGVRFTPDLSGRAAVLARLTDREGELRAVHGRYLEVMRGQVKMFTVGRPGGAFLARGALAREPLVLVEGLFDALSLAAAGSATFPSVPSIATIGRFVDWLPDAARGRTVWLAFDGNRPGERAARGWAAELAGARCLRLRPPGGRGDWNAAARRIGPTDLTRWLAREAVRALVEVG